jgi:hypothetical protein
MPGADKYLMNYGIIPIKHVVIYLKWILKLQHCLQKDKSGNIICDIPPKEHTTYPDNKLFHFTTGRYKSIKIHVSQQMDTQPTFNIIKLK